VTGGQGHGEAGGPGPRPSSDGGPVGRSADAHDVRFASLCTFLYAGALARACRLGEARYAFDKMLTYASHVGLFAEEISATGEQLGNFPQAFTHLALITAAVALAEELDRAEPWRA